MKKILLTLCVMLLIGVVVFIVFYKANPQLRKRVATWLGRTPDYHVVIVPGYGAPVAGHSQYEAYIKKVSDYVLDSNNQVNAVIFSGSYSNLATQSEAEAMNSYFNSITDLNILQQNGIHVYQEQCAIVSWQNISYSKDLLDQQEIVPTTVTLFGDEQRKDKLIAYATYQFNRAVRTPTTVSEFVSSPSLYTTINFIGYPFTITPNPEQDIQTFTELASVYDPRTSNRLLQARITQWTQQFHYDVASNLVAKGCTQYKGFK